VDGPACRHDSFITYTRSHNHTQEGRNGARTTGWNILSCDSGFEVSSGLDDGTGAQETVLRFMKDKDIRLKRPVVTRKKVLPEFIFTGNLGPL